MPKDDEIDNSGWRFGTTPWTDIIKVRSLSGEERSQRLSFLARLYWAPVYHYIRRRVRNAEDAKDLTQSFFAMILETGFVDRADKDRGKFRTYLLTALVRFLSADFRHQRSKAASPPDGMLFLSQVEDESMPGYESATPEQEFDRQWVKTVLDRVLDRLKIHCEQRGEHMALQVFSRRLFDTAASSYGLTRQLALELDVSTSTVDNAYRKCVRWYRSMFRQEIRSYVDSDSEVEEEIRQLWKAVE